MRSVGRPRREARGGREKNIGRSISFAGGVEVLDFDELLGSELEVEFFFFLAK